MRKGTADCCVATQLWLLGALCLSVIFVEQLHLLAFQAPELRAIIETAITLSALAAACLFGLSFGHSRNLRNLLLAGALLAFAVIDFVSNVLPSAVNLSSSEALTGGPMIGGLFMAAAMMVIASTGSDRQVGPGRQPLAVIVAAGITAAVVAEIGGLLLRPDLASGLDLGDHGLDAAIQHPIGAASAATAAALLVVAAGRTAGGDRAANGVSFLLAAAMIFFAGACLNYLVLPAPGDNWVGAREVIRIVGSGLILAAALRQEATIRQAIAGAAAAAERRRIARDLHDGLAQDLAFIAAHGDRISRESGEDHPLAIAARRALAVSRGAIADLSAAEAPTATAALRHVAEELEVRYGVRVSVEGDDVELRPDAREDVLRIAREAIVNAARAHAQSVVVSLTRSGERFVLRVLDDGVGIGTELNARPGFGIRAMRERAVSLGGGLTARPAGDGGTELKVVFP